jgi:hypothetical protein
MFQEIETAEILHRYEHEEEHRRRQGGRGVRTTPFGKNLPWNRAHQNFFLNVDRENLGFLTKRPPSANAGYAYEEGPWGENVYIGENVLCLGIIW